MVQVGFYHFSRKSTTFQPLPTITSITFQPNLIFLFLRHILNSAKTIFLNWGLFSLYFYLSNSYPLIQLNLKSHL